MLGRLLFVAVMAVLAPSALPAQDEAPRPAAADVEGLREIVREHGIRTGVERPGMMEYVRDVVIVVYAWFTLRIERLVPGLLGALERIAMVGAQILFFGALFLLAVLLGRVLLDQARRRRALAPREPPVARAAEGAEDPQVGREHDAWAEELCRRLAAGDVAAACEALWWWLARSLVQGSVERSWTSRELLDRAGRRDLRAPVRRLDRMIYGPVPPTVDEVRGLWNDLEVATG